MLGWTRCHLFSQTHILLHVQRAITECNMVTIAKATDSEPASVVCDMISPSSKWLTTLRVNFSKEVRRPCSVSAGCCFGRGGSRVSVCVRYGCFDGGVRGGDVVSEGGKRRWGGQAIAKMRAGGQCGSCSFFFKSGNGVGGGGSDRPAGGAGLKRERAERLAWTEAAVICWKAPYYTEKLNDCLFNCARL